MTEKVEPPKIDNSQPPHGETGGENKDSPSSRLPRTQSLAISEWPKYISETLKHLADLIHNNYWIFLLALAIVFVTFVGAYMFTMPDHPVIVIALVALFIIIIAFLAYFDKSRIEKSAAKIDNDLQYTQLATFTEEQKRFIKFYSDFGSKKLKNLERVKNITFKMLDTDNYQQIRKKLVENHLHYYQSSAVYRESRDGLYIEAVEGLDACKIHAMYVTYLEKLRTNQEGAINLFLDERPARNSMMWWEHPYDRILQNIILLVNRPSASRIISQLLAAYKGDKGLRFPALQLACKIAISGVFIENKMLRELLQAVTED